MAGLTPYQPLLPFHLRLLLVKFQGNIRWTDTAPEPNLLVWPYLMQASLMLVWCTAVHTGQVLDLVFNPFFKWDKPTPDTLLSHHGPSGWLNAPFPHMVAVSPLFSKCYL